MAQSTSGTLRTRREVTRRRRRERQIVVFGVLTIALAAMAFAAMAVYRGEADGPFSQPFVTPAGGFDSDVRLVCPPPSSFPMETSSVAVRVLNGTDVSGLAGGVESTLEGRGFVTLGAGNWSRSYEGTARVIFGQEGVQQAYTLARHFEAAELVLDTRENSTVDVVLGAEFNAEEDLRPLLAPELRSDLQLSANAECLPSHLVPAEPAPRTIPDDPFASDPSASPSASPTASADAEADAEEPTD